MEKLNETYPVSRCLIEISLTINAFRVYIPSLAHPDIKWAYNTLALL